MNFVFEKRNFRLVLAFSFLAVLLLSFFIILSFRSLLSKNSSISPDTSSRVVALIPHQDDEMFMSGMLMAFQDHGKDVYVALVTDGGNSNRRFILNGVDDANKVVFMDGQRHVHHPLQEGYFPLTRLDFSHARNREFVDSITQLGIPESHIIFLNPGGINSSLEAVYRDGSLSSIQADEVLQKLYDTFGDGIYLSVADGHSDHVALEQALKRFPLISQKVFFPFDRSHANRVYVLTKSQMERKYAALEAYSIWNPKERRFAIGGSSVTSLLSDWRNKTVEYYYTIPE